MNLDTWRWYLNHLKPYHRSVAGLLVIGVVFGLIDIATTLILQRLVDTAVAGTMDVALAILLIGLFFTSSIPLPRWIGNRIRNRFLYQLRGDLHESLLRMDISFHDGRRSTELTTEVSKGVSAAGNLFNLITDPQALLQLPVAIFAVYYLGQHSPAAVSILIGFLAVFGICCAVLGQHVTTKESAFNTIDNKLTHRIREVIQHFHTVKVSHAEEAELTHYWEQGWRSLKLRYKLINLYGAFHFLGNGAQDFATAVAVVFFLPQVVRGEISVGTFFALMLFAGRILGPAQFMGRFYSEIKQADANLGPVMRALATKPSVVEQSQATDLKPITEGITLRNVSFHYPGSEEPILKGVNLTIPAGKRTAIVGESGAGKSTLARLLTRLYEPTTGGITYDNIDVRTVSFGSLYREIAYLNQEVTIFSGTIYQNVSYGVANATRESVLAALEKASARFVYQLKDGIDTDIGEQGIKLSGGQRQRIAIARVHLRNPSVVILDEATSSLDTLTEHSVSRALTELGNGKTVVVIAHRLSTVVNADQIVVMDNGNVLDVGRHEELLKRCAVYHRLYTTPTESNT